MKNLKEVGSDLINIENICSVKRYYKGYNISRREEYERFYLSIAFIGGGKTDIYFDSRDSLEAAFTSLL